MSLEKILEDAFGAEWNDHNMRRTRPYSGQPHTSMGERGKTEIKGITFRDLRDCFIRAICLSSAHAAPHLYEQAEMGENAVLCENDVYGIELDRLDIMAVYQNLSCEIERLMGIYPNVPKLEVSDK